MLLLIVFFHSSFFITKVGGKHKRTKKETRFGKAQLCYGKFLPESAITILLFNGNSDSIKCKLLDQILLALFSLVIFWFIIWKLQNAQLDAFINESINTLAYKELETSHFLIKQFNETFLNISDVAIVKSDKVSKLFPIYSETNSDIFYSDNNSCFNNLIQFELEPHDTSFTKVRIFNALTLKYLKILQQ